MKKPVVLAQANSTADSRRSASGVGVGSLRESIRTASKCLELGTTTMIACTSDRMRPRVSADHCGTADCRPSSIAVKSAADNPIDFTIAPIGRDDDDGDDDFPLSWLSSGSSDAFISDEQWTGGVDFVGVNGCHGNEFADRRRHRQSKVHRWQLLLRSDALLRHGQVRDVLPKQLAVLRNQRMLRIGRARMQRFEERLRLL